MGRVTRGRPSARDLNILLSRSSYIS